MKFRCKFITSLSRFIYNFIICSLIGFAVKAQPGLYRTFAIPTPTFGGAGIPEQPIPTADGGYLLTGWFWAQGFEQPGGLSAGYVIKTDSNFVPQWRKNAAGAIALPTGGYILYNYNTIEKVTASGSQVFVKHLSSPIYISDAVTYGNKIRFVGNLKTWSAGVTLWGYYMSDGFTLLSDTNGTYISHQLFHSSLTTTIPQSTISYQKPADFSKIKRDSQGNFFIYSNEKQMSALGSLMSIAKFDTGFSFLWAKACTIANKSLFITDIDILPGGRIFASAVATGTNPQTYIRTSVLKLDAQGNLLSQHFFPDRFRSTALLKKPNGNYVMGMQGAADSLFLFEADTSMNIIWQHLVARASNIGGSVFRHSKIYTPLQKASDLVMISNDLSGNSCSSFPVSVASTTNTLTLSSFTLLNATFTTALISGTVNNLYSQPYTDSCNCSAFTPAIQKNYCVGTTATVSISGTGNLSWYATATGNTFIKSGPQYTYSSTSPTVLNIYAQDSACVLAPVRTLVSLTIHPVPFISFYPPNPLVCPGQQIGVTVNGAVNYTWSHNLPPTNIQYLNPSANTVYTVTGANAPNCSHTSTVALTIVPVPTITTISSVSVCLGQSATLTASGAINYTWTGGATGPTHTSTPASPGVYTFVVIGNNNACNATATASVLVLPAPSLTIFSTPPVLCSGVAATVSALGASNYSWSTGSTSQSIFHIPSTNTVFLVTGYLGQCSSTSTVPLTVNPAPTVIVSASQVTACANTQVSLTASGAFSYKWFGGPHSPAYVPVINAGPNNYVVTGTNGTCNATSMIVITGIPAPTVAVSVSASTVCTGNTVTISASGGNSYNWAHGPTSNSFTASYASAGQIGYSVTTSNGTCTAQSQVTVTALPAPTVAVSASSPTVCAGTPVTLVATGGNGYSWNHGPTGNSVIVSPLTSTIFAVLSVSNGCTGTGSISLSVTPLPVINIAPISNTVCIGDQLTLTATGASTYTWNSGHNSALLNVAATSTPVNYSVLGKTGQCTGSASAVVLGVSPPAMTVETQPKLICSGSQVTLTASGAQTYTWMNGSNATSIQIPAIAGATVTLAGAIGTCTSNSTVPWNVLPSPVIAVVSGNSVVCAGDMVKITAFGAASYTWNNGATTESIQAMPKITTSYTVTGAAANGCTADMIFTQNVDPCTEIGYEASETLQVFPNPTSGVVMITPLSDRSGIMQLTSIEGKVLLERTFREKQLQIDISFLPPGIYLLRLGTLTYPVKIIRQ